ncbi:MAG TPA: filamentous hemagglutinin [Cyanobacteria bacterium UBA8803]|nr:filamentous hemagglutinin [Cyanobacteria bacterium UBA9273]HBL59862.1 filamentous hemagglutinin [Cyanobacteria bacterium UBA8803]
MQFSTRNLVKLTLYSITSFTMGWLVTGLPVFAQIVGDETLPTNSQVIPAGNTTLIEGGTAAGSLLFHSFQVFSVPTGTTAFFNNSPDIQNIISRVTGNSASWIDGLLKANGTANLFLLNPNGIIFGPNATLDIGGSLIASTANSIQLADGTQFSATSPASPSLLTINVPIGLQYGTNAAAVEVQQSRLAVPANQTLALLGGNVSIEGGRLLAPGGQLVLGGLAGEGTIAIQGITPSFPAAISRGNVAIANGSIVDATGVTGGSISLYVDHLNLSGGSQLLTGIVPNNGLAGTTAGDILVNATGNITLSDRSLIANTLSSGALGNGGDIDIQGNTVALTSGSRMATVTQAPGAAGNIQIATNSLDISGLTADGLFSGILSHSTTLNSGLTGKISITPLNNQPGSVRAANRGFIATVTDSSSNGGAIAIDTHNLLLESGGQILTLARNGGKAGDITVNATGSVTMIGSSKDFIRSPFEGVTVYNLDGLPFSMEPNPEVEASGAGGIPYISLQRTPEQIISGQTVFGTASEGFDYYAFTINALNSRVIFDIDGGDGYSQNPGSLDTELVLFNGGTGEVIANNDDANENLGADGSIVNQDSYISTLLSPGSYVIGVGEFDTVPSSLNLLEGDRVDRGDTYRLQVSLQNQGTLGAFPPTPNNFNPNNFNPNYGKTSGLVSRSESSGNTGRLTINTPQFVMASGAEIAATASGTGKVEDITVNATTVDINNATISNITRGSGDAGSIVINAGEVQLSDRGLLNISNLGQGNTGDIQINADNVTLVRGGRLDNGTYIRGNTGKIVINAQDTVSLDGEFKGDTSHIFNIVAGPSAVGNAGGIEINTGFLSLTNGGSLNSTTYGEGNAGDIIINASEGVLLDGIASNRRGSNLLNRVRGTGRGNAGDINITTPIFSMTNGAEVFNRTEGIGDAGNFNITADEIFLSNSRIASSVEPGAVGNGGTLNFSARTISLTNGAKVSASTSGQGDAGQIFMKATDSISLDNSQISTAVSSQGTGSGGNIQIEADALILDNQASLTAATASGRGGDISLRLNDLLLMRRNSQITATAGTAGAGGDGGNIDINAPFIVAVQEENSDITANAFEGNGGKVQVTASGIFGLKFRAQQTPFSDITASSAFGVAGVVQITTLQLDPNSGLLQLPENVTDPAKQVIIGCAAARGNSFTVTGRGGLPEDPTATIRGQTVWQDMQDFSDLGELSQDLASPSSQSQFPSSSSPIIEATGWIVNAEGNMELVAHQPTGTLIRPSSRNPGCI